MLLSTTGTGASSYGNDADGNTLTGGGRTSTWDSQNRMVSCIITGSSSTFKYGADGLRRQKTTNSVTTDYAYDGSMMVREGVASGGTLSTVKATYLIGARGPEYRRDDTATELDGQGRTVTKARWYVYDGLGSVVGEVDPLGNLTSSPKYDVYGAVRGNGGTATSKQGFVGSLGHLSEAETGLVYMRARYYDPQTGRFVSEDPGCGGNNWFNYCASNPINHVDADGRLMSQGAIFLVILNIAVEMHIIKKGPFEHLINFLASSKEAMEIGEDTIKRFEQLSTVGKEAEAGESIDPIENMKKVGYAYADCGATGIVAAFAVYQFFCLMEMGPDENSE